MLILLTFLLTPKIAQMTALVYPLVFGTWEIVAIVAVVLLLFGGKKIPELMKGMGKGVKSFKEGMKEVESEIKEDVPASEPEKKD